MNHGEHEAARGKGAFPALAHRDFRLFWCGQAVSLIGTWMQSVGQSWLVLELTGSPLRLGLVSTMQFLPMLLLSVFSGVWVDRLPKRRLIMATQTVLMTGAFTLFALTATGLVRYWHIAALAFVMGCAQSLDLPARQSFFVEMVGKGDLTNAIALNSAVFNGARIIGPAMAGVMVATTGTSWAFLINGISFLAVISALAAIRAEGTPKAGVRRNILAEVAEGVRYSVSTPLVAVCLCTMALVSLFSINQQVLMPLLARNVLRVGADGLGLIMSAQGMGALAGALILAKGSRSEGAEGKPGLVFVGALGLASSLLLIRAFPVYAGAIVFAFIGGVSQITLTTSVNTGIQLVVPDALRGRVMGLYGLVFTGVTPLGSLMMGTVAAGYGTLAAFTLAGLGGLVSTLAVLVYRVRTIRVIKEGKPVANGMGQRLRAWAKGLKGEIIALYHAMKHPRTPLTARIACAVVVGYALSPIDLIPDFIPVLGYLDDVILLPLGIALVLKAIPRDIMEECRAITASSPLASKPRSWAGAAVIALVWIALALIAVRAVMGYLNPR